MGVGTWEVFGSGKVLVGVDATQTEFDTVEETGGEKTVTLSEDEMPAHKHITPNKDGRSYSSLYGDTTGLYNYWNDTDGVTSTATTGAPLTSEVGNSDAHNNLQPYITVYFWKRTA
jgi:microcystin-dependent protein